MVYLAAGLSGVSTIVTTFFVKEHLALTAQAVATLGFWVTLPWTMKMVIGHCVDLIWRYKHWLLVLGAAFAFSSAAILLGLLEHRAFLERWMTAESWYILSALLGPVGYVLQDVVADAMTIDAVPRRASDGSLVQESDLRMAHTNMQALSRGTLIVGGLLVSLVNLLLFDGARVRADAYRLVAWVAMGIPLLSLSGLILARISTRTEASATMPATRVDGLLLGGGVAFALVSLALGLTGVPHAELWTFIASMLIVGSVMLRLIARMELSSKRALLGTAIALFVFRAMPDAGPGPTWWMIDQLHVNEQFFATLSFAGSILALTGLFLFRRYMAEHSVTSVIVALSVVWTICSMPGIGLYYGLPAWLSHHTGGLLEGRSVVWTDTVLLSLLSEIAMVPMLAWVARSAPANLKATYFAVLVSFVNLGFLLSRLATTWLNEIFVVTREVRDSAGRVVVAADYSQLGPLCVTVAAMALIVPPLTVALIRCSVLSPDVGRRVTLTVRF